MGVVGGDKGVRRFSFNLGQGGGGGGGSRRRGGRDQPRMTGDCGGGVEAKDHVPKGCLAIKVGEGQEHELQRFVVPVMYFNHPLFSKLLKVAEEVYGFDQKGTIIIPCCVEEFRYVQGLIDEEMASHHHHHHHRPIIAGCFRD
ncbi:hypothetical protein Dimus_025367 [Dionaea muscipula]